MCHQKKKKYVRADLVHLIAPLQNIATKAAVSVLFHLPKASCVEWLAALQPGLQVLKVICELLILSELHHVIEVLHMLHHRVQLMEGRMGLITGNWEAVHLSRDTINSHTHI